MKILGPAIKCCPLKPLVNHIKCLLLLTGYGRGKSDNDVRVFIMTFLDGGQVMVTNDTCGLSCVK